MSALTTVQVLRLSLSLGSLELHVPTLIGNSYNQDGRMQGAQLASVPVTVPQNDTQVWEAKFDNRLPLDLHGADITAKKRKEGRARRRRPAEGSRD